MTSGFLSFPFLGKSSESIKQTPSGKDSYFDEGKNMKMDRLVCKTCGTQMIEDFDESRDCPICFDDRQYVPHQGQLWATQRELQLTHSVRVKQLKENLYEFTTSPSFGIGQRAIFLITEDGNMLWDCIPLLSEPLVSFIRSKGGLDAIGFSHPHYYSNMNTWAETFDCPIYIHELDKEWVFDMGNKVELWSGGQKELFGGLTLINLGGHFPGSSVVHATHLSENGILCCGDTFYISLSMKHASVMYSYPNRIPLLLKEIRRIEKRVEQIAFDELYGFWSYQNVVENPKKLILDSLKRYN